MVGWIVLLSNIFTHKIKSIFYLARMVKKDFLPTGMYCSSIQHLDTQNKIDTLFGYNRKKKILFVRHIVLPSNIEIHTLFD